MRNFEPPFGFLRVAPTRRAERAYASKTCCWGRSKIVTAVLALLLIIAWMSTVNAPAWSQTTTGSISGTVTDQSGGALLNAEVVAVNEATRETHKTSSNSSGNYIFPALVPGNYVVHASATGFATQNQTGIRLDVNQNAHVSFVLSPGSVSQSITVSAAGAEIDTTESQLGQTVDQKRIEDLPLNGRSAYSLVLLSPGVTNYTGTSPTGSYNGVFFSTNGLRINYNSFYLDGAYDSSYFRGTGNLIPNPDALEEFRVLTSNFDAEYGRLPGGVVNLITRSGTNRFHGLLYEYLRNNDLNATQEFVKGTTPLKQNQFGGNFGGPILRNRTFFFGSYEGLRIATPVTIASTSIVTPTPAEAGGDLSALPPSKYPKQPNGTVYSCNGKAGVICPNLLDPVTQNMLKLVPLADPTTGITPQQRGSANSSANQELARLDTQLNDSQKLSATVFIHRGLAMTPTAGSNEIMDYSGTTQTNGQTNVALNDAWTLSPTKLNNLGLFFTLNHTLLGNIYNKYFLNQLGSQIQEGAVVQTQPEAAITGYFDMGSGSTSQDDNSQQSLGASDSFLWTHGNHQIKLGGSFVWFKYAETAVYDGSTASTFTGSTTGNALADFLLGKANSLRQNSGTFHRLHAPDPSLFAQDDWRVNHRLTLDVGLRWELYAPLAGQNNYGTFRPFAQSTRFPTAPIGMLFSGDPGIPDGVLHTQWKDFAPRFGFAYDMYGSGQTVLRGGVGLFYSALQGGLNENLEEQPFSLDITINKTPNMVTPYDPAADPFPYVVSTQHPVFQSGGAVVGIPPNGNSSTPYVEEYNLNIEQQLGKHWMSQIAYVGNVSRKMYLVRDQNQPVYSPGASTSTTGLNNRRPYQPTPSTYVFSSIYELDPAGNSSYNALQLTLSRRFEHNFSVLANYTWSKTMDFVSGDSSSLLGSQLVDNNNIGYDYGLSSIDVPQNFVVSYMYAAPNFHRWGFFGRQLVGGWQLNGITTLQSGTPFNILSGIDSNLNGVDNDRPNLVGDPRLAGGRSRQEKVAEFFNTAAFAQVPAGTPYGNVPRDFLFGPGYASTDFSAFKNFALWHEQGLQIRGEFFNLFNHVNLGNPSGTMTSSLFGKIGTAGSPRIVQVAARYSF